MTNLVLQRVTWETFIRHVQTQNSGIMVMMFNATCNNSSYI